MENYDSIDNDKKLVLKKQHPIENASSIGGKKFYYIKCFFQI